MARRTRQHRSATSWRDAAHRKTNSRRGPTAGAVALSAVRGYGRWVGRSPDTRGLANALAVLYPLGEIGHQAGADPLMLGADSRSFSPASCLRTESVFPSAAARWWCVPDAVSGSRSSGGWSPRIVARMCQARTHGRRSSAHHPRGVLEAGSGCVSTYLSMSGGAGSRMRAGRLAVAAPRK